MDDSRHAQAPACSGLLVTVLALQLGLLLCQQLHLPVLHRAPALLHHPALLSRHQCCRLLLLTGCKLLLPESATLAFRCADW